MKVKFRGGEKKLPLSLINKLLATYDKAKTPADKKKVVMMTTHNLRKSVGLKSTMKGDDAPPPRVYQPVKRDSVYTPGSLKDPIKKLGKMSIPAPKRSGRSKGPSGKELRDIERGK